MNDFGRTRANSRHLVSIREDLCLFSSGIRVASCDSVDSTRMRQVAWRGDVPPISTPFVFRSPGEQVLDGGG